MSKIEPVTGWLLICRDEPDIRTGDDPKTWHIAWDNVFVTKKAALSFARENNWPRPFRAVRGALHTTN
jgi:hypothetical protein